MREVVCRVRALVANAADRARGALLGAGIVSFAGLASAAAPPPVELFFKPPEVLQARLSPNGTRLAVTTSVGGERIGLVVWDLDPDRPVSPARPVARFSDIDVHQFRWVGEERLVFSVIDRTQGSGLQRARGLYTVRASGGRPADLPRGLSLLSVPQAWPDAVMVGRLERGAGDVTMVTPQRHSLISGARETVEHTQLLRNVTRWWFDPSGEPRLAEGLQQDRRRLHWLAPGAKEWALLDDSPRLEPPFAPQFVDGQGQLYVTVPEAPHGRAALTRWDFAAGRPSPTPLLRVPGFDYAGEPVFEADGSLAGLHLAADGPVSVWFDGAARQLQEEAEARLPGYAHTLVCRRCGTPQMVALVHSTSDRDPGVLWVVRGVGEQRRWQRLARVMSGVDPQAMASVELHRISARDGRELPVWLTVPPGRQAAKAGAGGPAVVLVHGGPWLRGGQWEWRALEQFLASRGFLVIAPEFRGSTGYGHAHFRAGFRQWGRAMQDDLLDAAAWARSQGWADRFCIAGGSYGGYATLMGLARDGDFWRCGAAWAAVADLPLFLKGSLSVGDDVSEDGRRHTLPVMVGDPKMDAAMLDAVSPVKLAAQMRAPLLLAWGERDQRVPLAHADRLRRALREAGRPEPLWVSYPDEGHSWLQPENQIDFARRLEAFFNEHLRPAAGRPTEPPPRR